MNLFTNTIFTEGILPFLLVFVLVFAVLQKTKILGEGKSQIDALVSLAIGLILVGTPTPRNYIINMMPWLAVALVVLLVFFLLYGFAAGSDKEKGFVIPGWTKNMILILAIIFVVVLVLNVTGTWGSIKDWLSGENVIGNILIIAAIGVAMWVAFGGSKSGS
jgi:hypothetical protein